MKRYLFSVMSAAFLIAAGGPEGSVSRMDDVGKVLKVQNIMPKGDMVSIPFGIKPGMVIPDGRNI